MHESLDRDTGPFLQVAGHGQRREHDRQVCLDRVLLAPEADFTSARTGSQRGPYKP